MKQFYLILGLLTCTIFTYAEEVTIADFENGEASGWSSWQETATVEEATNPSIDATNGSDKVLKLISDGDWGSVTKWEDNGILAGTPSKITFKVYATVASTIKLHMDNSDSTEELVEMFQDVSANKWTVLEFDLSSIPAIDYKQLAIQNGTDGTFYIDDIVVSYQTTSTNNSVIAEISSANNYLQINGAEGADIIVYNITGFVVKYIDCAKNNVSVQLSTGVYFIKVNSEIIKVLVQ